MLYFVSTTVNPILYNVLSRKYRQAFMMTLCNACMDDATRQRLQRDGFGGFTVYYSTTAGTGRVSTNRMSVVDAYETVATTPTRRRAVGAAHLRTPPAATGPVESATTAPSSFGGQSPRAFTPAARFQRNGRVNVAAAAADTRRGGGRLTRACAADVAVADDQSLIDEHLLLPYRHTSPARQRAGDNGPSLTESDESNVRLQPEPL